MRDGIDQSAGSLVSVVVPFLNAERFLAEAVDSVLSQTYPNWELFLIDDGSTDSGARTALGYAERHPDRIRYLTHPGNVNRGTCASRNLGLRHSRGRFVAVLDADDTWMARTVEEQVALMDAYPEAGMVYGQSEYWHDPFDWPANAKSYIPPLAPPGQLYYPPTLLRLSYPLGKWGAPCPSTFFLRREALERVGGFEESFDRGHQLYEDTAFLAKLYLQSPVVVSGQLWSRYRIHGSGCSAIWARQGRTEVSRRFYFEWLEQYLRQNGLRDEEIWRTIRRRTWKYRHQFLAGVYGRVRQRLGQFKRAALRRER